MVDVWQGTAASRSPCVGAWQSIECNAPLAVRRLLGQVPGLQQSAQIRRGSPTWVPQPSQP